ncbi:hypothetical protein M0804_008360 [Polistes exclamans]|nr:hypothetical protein M0804_008360 [Polistes exclamans]
MSVWVVMVMIPLTKKQRIENGDGYCHASRLQRYNWKTVELGEIYWKKDRLKKEEEKQWVGEEGDQNLWNFLDGHHIGRMHEGRRIERSLSPFKEAFRAFRQRRQASAAWGGPASVQALPTRVLSSRPSCMCEWIGIP